MTSYASHMNWKRYGKYALYVIGAYLIVVTAIAFIRPLV